VLPEELLEAREDLVGRLLAEGVVGGVELAGLDGALQGTDGAAGEAELLLELAWRQRRVQEGDGIGHGGAQYSSRAPPVNWQRQTGNCRMAA